MRMNSQTILTSMGPWERAVGRLKQQLKLMTGGGKHCWQQQQQHVIWEWKFSSIARLNPNLWSDTPTPPSTIWWNSIIKQSSAHGFNTKQVHRLTQRFTQPYMMVAFVGGGGKGEAVPCLTPSFHRRLPHTVVMRACCLWHVTGGLADFVALPDLLSDTVSVRDISVRVRVWACQDLLLRTCSCVYTCEHLTCLHPEPER